MFALRMKKNAALWLLLGVMAICTMLISSCANIVPPTGGPRDTLGPQILRMVPESGVRNFTGNRITLQFDEYVQVENAFENVIVSPTQENAPLIDARLRTVTIRLRDSLEPNTTYSINFGNAIKDINESNPFRDFNFVFSTGQQIDSFSLSGKVLIAQTGKVDSTLIVMLHRNLADSAVAKQRPRYYTRLDNQGNFTFENLPAGTFRVYTLKDEGFRRYTDEKTVFGYADSAVTIGPSNPLVNMYAFVGDPGDAAVPAGGAQGGGSTNKNEKADKNLKYQTSLQGGEQDLIGDLQISFSKKLKTFDSAQIILTDTFYKPVAGYSLQLDTARQTVTLKYPWKEVQYFRLILPKEAVADSAGATLARNDTIRVRTKGESDYGSVRATFSGVDFSKNPLIQWVQSDKVVRTDALTSTIWTAKLFQPGTYDIRILYDTNKNGVWDRGDFWKRKQPEVAVAVPKSFNVRANWDNEFTIAL